MDRRDVGQIDGLRGTSHRVIHRNAARFHVGKECKLRVIPCVKRLNLIQRQDNAPPHITGARVGAGVDQPASVPHQIGDGVADRGKVVVACVHIAGKRNVPAVFTLCRVFPRIIVAIRGRDERQTLAFGLVAGAHGPQLVQNLRIVIRACFDVGIKLPTEEHEAAARPVRLAGLKVRSVFHQSHPSLRMI